MFDPKAQHRPLALRSRREFILHALRNTAVALGFFGLSLGIGIVGYWYFAGLDWLDSLLNAAMILTGMGPVTSLITDEAKIFASLYAIYSGIAFTAVTAVILYPFVNRMVKILHLQSINSARDPSDGDQQG